MCTDASAIIIIIIRVVLHTFSARIKEKIN